MSLFDEEIPQRPEIVEGLFREGQIVTIAGAYNVGKTPLLAHIAVCAAYGQPIFGRRVAQRHVVHADFESSLPAYVQSYRNICTGLGVRPPKTPEQVAPYLSNANDDQSKIIRDATRSVTAGRNFLHAHLTQHPDALIILDPVEMFWSKLSLSKPDHVLTMVSVYRDLFAEFPKASVLASHNLRKLDTKMEKSPSLLENPHGWLREISGSSNLLNRSDVRIGMDRYNEDVRIMNGVRRSEDMHPIWLLPIEVDDDPERLGGFRSVSGNAKDLRRALGDTMAAYFAKLPPEFKFNDVARNGVPRTTLWRILKRTESLGYVVHNKDTWSKVDTENDNSRTPALGTTSEADDNSFDVTD